jgi:hypothetical protein
LGSSSKYRSVLIGRIHASFLNTLFGKSRGELMTLAIFGEIIFVLIMIAIIGTILTPTDAVTNKGGDGQIIADTPIPTITLAPFPTLTPAVSPIPTQTLIPISTSIPTPILQVSIPTNTPSIHQTFNIAPSPSPTDTSPIPTIPILNPLSTPSSGNVTVLHNTTQTMEKGYLSFGSAIQIAPDSILYFARNGTSHASDNGVLLEKMFNLTKNAWQDEGIIIYSNPNFDVRNINAIKLDDGSVTVGATLYNVTDESSYGLVTLNSRNWTAVQFVPNSAHHSFYNTALKIGSTYEMIAYTIVSRVHYDICFVNSTDGLTWQIGKQIAISSGTLSETTVVPINDGRYIALARNDSSGQLVQFNSPNGYDWAPAQVSNIGSLAQNIPYAIQTSANNITIAYADRALQKMMLISQEFNTAYSNPQFYPQPKEIELVGPGTLLGYETLIKISDSQVWILYNYENINSNQTYTFTGFYNPQL